MENNTQKLSFKKYGSIENHYNEKEINKMSLAIGPSPIKWVIMEKIHGANFQLHYSSSGIHYGKRNSFLGTTENFYDFQKVVTPSMTDKMKEIYDYFKEEIRVYGELFGGIYENKISNCKAIQREVQYCPFHYILFYDVMIGDRMLSWKEIEELKEKFNLSKDNLHFEEPIEIKEATIFDIIKENNAFKSIISQRELSDFNLPEIQKNNTCEGIIIKPYEKEYIVSDGSRVIIKSKNEKFLENKYSLEKLPKVKDEHIVNDLLFCYVNENRITSVLSKDSWIKKDFNRFLDAVYDDVLEEAKKDNVIFPDFDKDLLLLEKDTKRYIASFRKVFLDICND